MFVEAPGAQPVVEEAQAQPRPGGLEDLPLERLEHEICQLAANLAAGMSRWLALVAEFDARDGWESWAGIRSCAEWIAWRCALSPRAAREHVRVARDLRDLPLTRDAFDDGRLSYSKVRVLTRVADADSEADLLELAHHATAAQLERMLRAFRRVTREEVNTAYESRHVAYYWEEDGSFRISAHLPAEEGALVVAALEAARSSLREEQRRDRQRGPAEPRGAVEPSGSAEPRELGGAPSAGHGARHCPHPTNADALVAVAESALARAPSALSGGPRHQVVVHVDLGALVQDGDGSARLRDGPAICSHTARRLGCDSTLTTVLEREGEILSVGRKTRAVPTPIRRGLEVRDQGCRFPGCNHRRWVDAHHIKHWVDGGATSLDNLVLLCRHHHRLLHEGDYKLEVDPDGALVFRHPRGWRIADAPPLPRGDVLALRTGAGPLFTGTGERMRLGPCVDAVFAATGRT
jgi:Domain of unknown function (DUF222)/HNH endonuclease